jgi:ATP-binding cassette subfamily B protein
MARPQKLRQSLPVLGRFARRFWPLMRRERALVAGSMSMLVVEVFLRLLEPWPLSFVVDHVLVPSPDGQVPYLEGLSALDPGTLITLAAVALVCFTGLRALSRYLSAVGFALTGNRLMNEVRADLYHHIQNLSLAFHNKSRSGDLLVRVIGDVGLMREVAVTAFLPLLGNVLVLTGMVAVMFWMNWQLAAAALVTAPLFLLSTVRLGRRIQSVSRKQRQREGGMASTAAESIGAIQTVQALSLDGAFSETFLADNRKSLKEGVQAKRLSARLERTVDVLNALATALVLWLGARIALSGALSAGELLVFLSYLKSAFRPVRNFAKYAARIAKASASAERVLEVMDLEADVRDADDAVAAPAFRGDVKIEGVDFAYEPGHPVLRGVDLHIGAGQRVALVGPSGCGKSTLVSLLLRLHDPGQGCVRIDGEDIRRYTLVSLRAQTSVVLQDTLLFASSVRENIACGANEASAEQVEAAARLANADDFIRRLPQGYETPVGERGVTLSRGQRQRLAVARAAVRGARLLILDEPASGLDEENDRALGEALERLAEGRTTLLVTHDLEQASRCDVVYFLEAGRVVEAGSHEELMRAGGRYATMYRLQAGTGLAAGEEEVLRALPR